MVRRLLERALPAGGFRAAGLTVLALWLLASVSVARGADASVRIIPAGEYAVRKLTGPYSGLEGAFREVGAWLETHKDSVRVAGPAIAVFHDNPEALPPEKLRSEAWIPIALLSGSKAPLDGGTVMVHREPARLVLRTVHLGPLATIRQAFVDLHRALPSRSLRHLGPSQHVYLDVPGTVPPEQQRTEARILVEPTGPTDLGIYTGRGAFGAMLIALSDTFDAGGVSVRVIEAKDVTDGKLAKRCRALLMPGGWAASYKEDLGAVGARRISAFVAKGNGYIGICAGAFFAAREIVWEGERIHYPLDLFAGVPTGPVAEIAPWPRFALTKLSVDVRHEITKGTGKSRTALYYGGPILAPKKGAKVKVLARFGEGGGAAIVAFSRGRGRAFLSSVHLEVCLGRDRAEIGWPDAEVNAPDPESDRGLLQNGVRWVLRRKPNPR